MDLTQDSVRSQDFVPGSEVVYGLHGRCSILAVESKTIGGENISFYKLQKQKPLLSRSKRLDPAIWLPVADAQKRGLRKPMVKEVADQVYGLLSSGEYFFSVEEDWKSVHPKLEKCILEEGGLGLAKIIGYLAILKNRQIVPPSEVNRFYDTVLHVLVRELAEIFQLPLRAVEERIEKSLQFKLRPDS